MKSDTKQKIVVYIKAHKQATAHELIHHLAITRASVHRQLNKLVLENVLSKAGKPPKVYYLLAAKKEPSSSESVGEDVRHVIDERYLFISALGEMKLGWEGFAAWCLKTKQDPAQTASEYIKTIKKFDSFRKDGLIDGMPKMKKTFTEVFLDELFYLDFYSIERFGKTKLGQMLLYAKQSQSRQLISELIEQIRPKILSVITKYDIDGVLFVPPSVRREVQFMKELEKYLHLPVRTLSVTKIKTEIIVPQKTLSKLEDRVENAKHTIILDDMGQYKNILLIDDAVGSGSTVNETARQIKGRKLSKGKIIGVAITGSFKGFDVISEV